MAPNGQQVDLPASVEQVGTVLQLMEATQAPAPPQPPPPQEPAPTPGQDPFAAAMGVEETDEAEAIRLAAIGGFGGLDDDDGDPL